MASVISPSQVDSVPTQMMVTTYLDNFGQGLRHGQVQEQLARELAEGCRVKSVSSRGGMSSLIGAARGWLLVVLENTEKGTDGT